jgi:peptidoglycan/LPS O-acetylase OafA/YrhL
MQALTPTKSRHIDALDGLRALAIGLVLLYHLTPMRNSDLGVRSLLFKIADIGWSGVDLFFVLSGFLITSKLLEARDDVHRYRDFYVRRALRILPLYYGVLAIVLLAGMPPLRNALPYILYYVNFIQYPLPTDSWLPVGHFWSLAVEEQFYLVWPAVIFAGRRRAAAICIAIAIAAPLLRFFLASSGATWIATYTWTPCRADGLAMGALIAIAGTSRRLAWSLIAAVSPFLAWTAWRHKADAVVINTFTPEGILLRTLLPLAVSLLFAAVLMLTLEFRPRILGLAPLRSIARYSYGIYVFHFMIMPALQRMVPGANNDSLVLLVVGSALSYGLAVVSYHAYESVFLRLKPRLA